VYVTTPATPAAPPAIEISADCFVIIYDFQRLVNVVTVLASKEPYDAVTLPCATESPTAVDVINASESKLINCCLFKNP
jgi:hypothetical protein